MIFEIIDYGTTDENGESPIIGTVEAESLEEAREIVAEDHPGDSGLYLWNEDQHGMINGR